VQISAMQQLVRHACLGFVVNGRHGCWCSHLPAFPMLADRDGTCAAIPSPAASNQLPISIACLCASSPCPTGAALRERPAVRAALGVSGLGGSGRWWLLPGKKAQQEGRSHRVTGTRRPVLARHHAPLLAPAALLDPPSLLPLHCARSPPFRSYFFDESNVKNGGNRWATVLMYLVQPEEGGETGGCSRLVFKCVCVTGCHCPAWNGRCCTAAGIPTLLPRRSLPNLPNTSICVQCSLMCLCRLARRGRLATAIVR